MNFIIFSTDSRYDSGHRNQNADVHLENRARVIWLFFPLMQIETVLQMTDLTRGHKNWQMLIFFKFLTTMTNKAGATNAQMAPFFSDSQQLKK